MTQPRHCAVKGAGSNPARGTPPCRARGAGFPAPEQASSHQHACACSGFSVPPNVRSSLCVPMSAVIRPSP